jgi:predicted MFS family arabinose efflux permease
MFFSTMLICVGTAITGLANSFNVFIVGRAFTGAGAGGILIVSSIIVIQMTSPKRRGLYIALVNSGMTVGVSLGAVIAGALEPKIGWVRVSCSRSSECCLTLAETALRRPVAHQLTCGHCPSGLYPGKSHC